MAQSIKLGSDTYLDASAIASKFTMISESNKTIPSGTTTTAISWTVPSSGVWLFIGSVWFNGGFSSAYNNNIGVDNTIFKTVRTTGENGGGSDNVYIASVAQGQTVFISTFQNSGGSLIVRCFLQAIKLAGTNH